MEAEGMLSIVIPVYRSEKYLSRTVKELVDYFTPIRTFEIILVNDGSPDAVAAVIAEMCAFDPRIRGMTLGCNIGQHRATLAGLAQARGEFVVTLDDDGQNPPQAALAVLEAVEAGQHDVAYGRFATVEQSGARRLASWLNRWISRRTIQNSMDIAITNVRAMRGDLARAIGAIDSPYPYIDALVFRMTKRIGEVAVPHRQRNAGESSYTLGKLLHLWISHVTSLSVLPLRFAMIGSFGVSALGFAIGSVELVRVMIERRAPAGWLSLFVAVTFLFSVLFVFLGIISAYLGRMYVTLNERGLVWVRSRHGVRSSDARGDAIDRHDAPEGIKRP